MKDKQRQPTRRKYDATFKKEVLQMAESGRPITEIAQSLGVGENLIYRWRSGQRKKSTDTIDTAVPAFDDEKRLLHKRIQELEMERDILKKALAIFSRPTL